MPIQKLQDLLLHLESLTGGVPKLVFDSLVLDTLERWHSVQIELPLAGQHVEGPTHLVRDHLPVSDLHEVGVGWRVAQVHDTVSCRGRRGSASATRKIMPLDPRIGSGGRENANLTMGPAQDPRLFLREDRHDALRRVDVERAVG